MSLEKLKRKKLSKWDMAIIVLLLVISTMAFLLYLKTNECMTHPLVYGAQQYTELNSAEFSCTCLLDVPNSPVIKVNPREMTVENPYRAQKEILDIDFSSFNVKE